MICYLFLQYKDYKFQPYKLNYQPIISGDSPYKWWTVETLFT